MTASISIGNALGVFDSECQYVTIGFVIFGIQLYWSLLCDFFSYFLSFLHSTL